MAANLWKLMLIRALHMGILVMPIIVVFWRSLGLSLTEIFILQATFSGTMLALELPSGYLADYFGRRKVLVGAYVVTAAGFFVHSVSYTFWGFFFGEVLLGMGISAISGTDISLLFDSLKADGRESEFARTQGRFVFWAQSSEAAAALIGGALALISLRLPFYVYTGQLVLAAAVAWTLVEPERERFREGAGHLGNFRSVLEHLKRTPMLLRLLAFHAVVAASSLTAAWIYQPYWQHLRVPLAWFGPLWCALNLIVAFAAWNAHSVRRRFGGAFAFGFIALMPAVGYLGLGLTGTLWGLGFVVCIQLMRGLNSVLTTDEINQRTGSEMRATVNSLGSGGVRLIFVVFAPCLGVVADGSGVPTALLLCGGVYGAAALAVYFFLRRAADRKSTSAQSAESFGEASRA